jgi:4-methoxybenzoate monooxygenase (O-demethylating)
MTDAAVLDIDPFSDDFLGDPDPYHERLRDAGPVVFLEKYGIWAMARFAEVHTVLRDHETYCSSAGVGLSDFRKEKPWRPPSLLLEADPPEHTKVRRVMARVMSPRTLERLRPNVEQVAGEMVAALVARGTFDGTVELARAYPLRVFPDAVGLGPEGRENLLAYGGMVFNAFGPRNRLFQDSMAAADPVRGWIAEHCSREALSPDGLGAEIYAAADAGEITDHEAGMLVRSLVSAGVDTTVHALGALLHALSAHPDQWRRLRGDLDLVRPAFEEALRYGSPVQTFFRTTTRPVEIAGTAIPDGEKVLLFLGAANRDPREWRDPDSFDIGRRATGHVAFGSGIHACVGAAFARLEAECLLTAMIRQIDSVEPAGRARPLRNNTLRGWTSLPLRVHAAN